MDNDEIKGLIKEYTTHFDNYNDLRKSGKSLYLTRSRLVRDAEDMYKEIGDFDKINDAIGRNHSLPLEMAVALTNGVIELGQGIGTAAEAIRYYTNPFGRLGDYLVDSGAFDETPVLKSFIDVAQTIQGGFTRFDDDAKTTSGTEWLHGKIDQAQEYLNSTVEKPQQFSDIDSISDAGEWAATMFAGQVPQLALMIATGGRSAWVSGGLMAASAGGGYFMGMEEQKKLFEETGGLYGEDFGFEQMFWSSAMVGVAEALSEQITMGQIRGVSKFKLGARSYNEGVGAYFRRQMFTEKGLLRYGKDVGEEGLSEVAATMAENYTNIINGDKTVSIFDNIGESFVSGGLISTGIKSPILFHHMTAPFISPDNKAVIDAGHNRVDQLLGMLSMGRPVNGTDKEIKQWEKKEKEYLREIAEINVEMEKALEFDVRRVGNMTDKQKRDLLDIHSDQRRIEAKNNELLESRNKGEISEKQFAEQHQELKNQYSDNVQRKGDILGGIDITETDRRYKKDMEATRQRADELSELKKDKNGKTIGTQVEVTEGNSNDFFSWMAGLRGYTVFSNENTGEGEGISMDEDTRNGYINQNQEVINNADEYSKQEVKEAKDNIKKLKSKGGKKWMMQEFLDFNGGKNNYGAHVPTFGKNGQLETQQIFVNKSTSHDAGMFYTGSHELLHGILHQTLKRDPGLQMAFGNMVITALNNAKVKIPDALRKRIEDYNGEGNQGEEIMTLVSEAHRDGSLKLPKDGIKKFKNFFRGWSQKTTNRDISFDTDQDVINFIQDYSFSMKNNKENKAISKMWQEGVGGKLIADAKQRYSDKVKKNKRTKGEINFSKNVDQELNNNPDLLTEIDAFVKNEDGTPKYTSKSEWQTSVDFADAYMYITQKKKLDGLIQAGMVGEGVNTAQALGEFTRKV